MARIDHESGSILRKALRAQYPLPQYAVLYEVASGMGKTFGGYFDAMVMSLFPSRGLDIHGFEIKTDRGDWLKELKDPAKADRIAKFCDFWWLLIGEEGIAKPEEVPNRWGLYVLDEKDKLKAVKRPKKLKAVPPDREFVGAMLRRANEMAERERLRSAEAMDKDDFVMKTRAEIHKELKKDFADDLEMATLEHKSLKREVETFEEISGIKITKWNGQRMGEAVRLVANMKDARDISEIERLAIDIEDKAAKLKADALQLKQVGTFFASTGKIPI